MKFNFLEKITAVEKKDERLEKSEAELQEKIRERINYESLELENKNIFTPNVVDSLARLVLKLENKISFYDTILSDDASGRLVSLILRKVINSRRTKSGQPLVNTYFLQGGRHGKAVIGRVVEEFIEEKKPFLGKTLLVTEYIESGRSIQRLMKILEKQKVDFDLAAVSILYEPKKYPKELNQRLFYGTVGEAGLDMWGNEFHSGVKKGVKISAHPEKSLISEEVRSARRDAGKVSNELLKLFD